jgi:hypothetical protein
MNLTWYLAIVNDETGNDGAAVVCMSDEVTWLFLNNENSIITFQNASGGKLIPSLSWPNTTLYVTSEGGGYALLQLYTMCVLIKNNRPYCRLHVLNPTPYCGQLQNIPTLQSKVPPFADIHKCFRDRKANTGSWRGVQPGRGTGVEPAGLWSREFIAFISKIFRKVILGPILWVRACFGGLFVPAF